MKKIFIVFCLILFCITPVFAEYTPIPKNMSKQYKLEMEQIIDDEYNSTINNVDKFVSEAKEHYKNIIQNGYNMNDYADMVLISEVCIPAADIDLYAKLLKITQEKYLMIKYVPIGTDSTGPYDDYLSPYFLDNNINTRKLTKIIIYENKQIKIIKKYIKQVEKIRPKND